MLPFPLFPYLLKFYYRQPKILLKNMLRFFQNKYKKIKSQLVSKLSRLFSRPIDESTIEELEEILYESDLGSKSVQYFLKHIQSYYKTHKGASVSDFLSEMKKAGTALLPFDYTPPQSSISGEPTVILLVGVNGSGKTTSAAKLSYLYKKEKKKVLLVAADTFRAAAVHQLEIWAERVGVDLVKGLQGGDPSSVVFDGLTKAKKELYDIVIVDTAGRLESKTDLMKELEKIHRVAKKIVPSAPHATYLVLDATIGQSALEQAKIFHSVTPLGGLILTKMDGSAKGGIVIPLYQELKIPVCFVGLGESEEDFAIFNKEEYVEALFTP